MMRGKCWSVTWDSHPLETLLIKRGHASAIDSPNPFRIAQVNVHEVDEDEHEPASKKLHLGLVWGDTLRLVDLRPSTAA